MIVQLNGKVVRWDELDNHKGNDIWRYFTVYAAFQIEQGENNMRLYTEGFPSRGDDESISIHFEEKGGERGTFQLLTN